MASKQDHNSTEKPGLRIAGVPSAGVSAVACTNGGIYLASGRMDSVVFVWQISPKRLLFSVDVGPYCLSGSSPIVSLTFLTRVRAVRVACRDCTLLDITIPEGRVLLRHRLSSDANLRMVQLFDDGNYIAVIRDSGSVTAINVEDGHKAWEWKSSNPSFREATLSPDGQFLVIEDNKGIIRVFTIRSWEMVASMRGTIHGSVGSDFSRDSSLFLYASYDATKVFVWRKIQNPKIQSVPTETVISRLALSQNGRFIAWARTMDLVTIRSLDSAGTITSKFRFSPAGSESVIDRSPITQMAFSPDGHFLMMGDRRGNVQVLWFEEGKHEKFDQDVV